MDTENEQKIIFQITATPKMEEVMKRILVDKPKVDIPGAQKVGLEANSAAGIAICCNG